MYGTITQGYWKWEFVLLKSEQICLFLFRNLCPNYSFGKIAGREASLDVPDRVHFIWTGKVMPEKYLENIKTFTNNTSYEVSVKKQLKDFQRLGRSFPFHSIHFKWEQLLVGGWWVEYSISSSHSLFPLYAFEYYKISPIF